MIPRVVRALLAGLALLALVIGVPTLLVIYGRTPLDGDGSIIDQLKALPTQAISDNMAFGLLTIAAWIAWATFLQSVVVELGNALGSALRWRALGWSPFEMTARRLVTALTMTVSLSTSLGARAGGMPTLRPATVEATAGVLHDSTASPAPAGHRLAAAKLTPPANTTQDFGRVSLRAASESARSREPVPLPSLASAVSPVSSGAPSELAVVTVAPGDSPWALAEQHLGHGLRWRELWDLNRGVPQPDGRAWVVEDLIRPGWQLRLPAPPVEVPPAAPAVEPTPAAPGEAPCVPEDNGQQGGTGNERTDPGDVEPATPAPTTSTPAGQAEQEPTPDNPPDSSGPDDDQPGLLPDLAPPLAGITGATVLATSLALVLRRLRRDRAIRTARSWTRRPKPRATRADHAIAAAADVPLVRWAGQELAGVMQSIEADLLKGAAPVVVELSEERGIELLWDHPVPKAPPPWIATDDGWTWSLSYDPDAPVPPDQATSPIPALVTVGDRDGRQLMIDVEAFGSVSVVGPPDRVADFGRAVAFELGADEDLADAYVSTVGLGLGLDDHLRRLVTATSDSALETLRSTAAAVTGSLRDAKQNSTFGYRIARDDTYLEATVVLIDVRVETVNATPFVEASPPHRAVATVLLGEAPDAGATITIADDGMARIEPLGITFRAAGIPASTEQELTHLLGAESLADDVADDRHAVAVRPATPEAHTNGARDLETRVQVAAVHPIDHGIESNRATIDELPHRLPDNVSQAGATGADESFDPVGLETDAHDPASVEGSLLVRVLGTPFVPDRPALRRRELLLTVYMACRARPVTPSSIQNAVWGGRAVEPKTLWNVVARTRTALGALDDGSPVMPPTDRKSGTLRLSDRVVTDLALLQACYTHALQLPSFDAVNILRRGLALIEGEPFNAAGYEWAYRDEQYVAEASTLIENAVEHLVRLATEAGDHDAARHAISHGLRGLPGNEVLYRSRMRLEYSAGNVAGVETAWKELTDFLLDLDIDPSDSTVVLHTQLTRTR